MQYTYYLDLVIVFYTIAHMDGETRYLCVFVRGKSIVMTLDLGMEIAGLSGEGMIANEKGIKDIGVKFNKLATYKSLMKNPIEAPKEKTKERFRSGALQMEARLLAYVVAMRWWLWWR